MKIIRAYIITAIVCISITSIISCIFIADESAKKITLGEESTVLVLSSQDKILYPDAVSHEPELEKLKEIIKRAASISPPPISNLYWFFNAGKAVS